MKLKYALVILLCWLSTPALAQKTKAALTAEINAVWPDNTSGIITPAKLRAVVIDVVNSYYDLNGTNSLVCAANQWVVGLPTLSSLSCAQPTISNIAGLGTGVATFLGVPSSANLLAAMTTKTGTGNLVFGTSPTISTGFTLGYITGSIQCLHVDTAGAVTGTGSDCGAGGGSPGGSSGQVQYNNGGAFGGFTTSGDATINTGTGALTLATVNANVGTFGSATTCITTTQNAKGLTTAISAATCTPAIGSITGFGTGVASALAVNVGSAGAPVLFNGAGGTPSSMTGTNITGTAAGLTAGTASAVAVGGITGAGAGCITFLTTPSSANLRGCITDETGSGIAYFVGGALGTPASGVATNLTGTASGLTAGTVTTNANLTGLVTSTGNATSLSLGQLTNSLGADVFLNNVANFFDGPSVAQGSTGTWWASGTITAIDTSGAANIVCKLWDGTTVISSSQASVGSINLNVSVSLSGFITSPAGNIRISCKDAASTNGRMFSNNTGAGKDSTISVFRIN